METACLWIDQRWENVDIGCLQFGQAPVSENLPREFMCFIKLLEYTHFSREAGFCLFARVETKAVEQNPAQLFRRVDIEFFTSKKVDPPCNAFDFLSKFPGNLSKFIRINLHPRPLHAGEDGEERHFFREIEAFKIAFPQFSQQDFFQFERK